MNIIGKIDCFSGICFLKDSAGHCAYKSGMQIHSMYEHQSDHKVGVSLWLVHSPPTLREHPVYADIGELC
jgi:hypothetical protein